MGPLLLVVLNAAVFVLALLSWHSQMKMADSKNNQMLLSIAVCSAIAFVASLILTQTQTHHIWMGYLLLVFTQLGVLSVSIARFHQISRDSHTESALGSLTAQQIVNAVILFLSLVAVGFSGFHAYDIYHAQVQVERLVKAVDTRVLSGDQLDFSQVMRLQRLTQGYPLEPSLTRRSSLVLNPQHRRLMELIQRLEQQLSMPEGSSMVRTMQEENELIHNYQDLIRLMMQLDESGTLSAEVQKRLDAVIQKWKQQLPDIKRSSQANRRRHDSFRLTRKATVRAPREVGLDPEEFNVLY